MNMLWVLKESKNMDLVQEIDAELRDQVELRWSKAYAYMEEATTQHLQFLVYMEGVVPYLIFYRTVPKQVEQI